MYRRRQKRRRAIHCSTLRVRWRSSPRQWMTSSKASGSRPEIGEFLHIASDVYITDVMYTQHDETPPDSHRRRSRRGARTTFKQRGPFQGIAHTRVRAQSGEAIAATRCGSHLANGGSVFVRASRSERD